jgi:hypothetical protein
MCWLMYLFSITTTQVSPSASDALSNGIMFAKTERCGSSKYDIGKCKCLVMAGLIMVSTLVVIVD